MIRCKSYLITGIVLPIVLVACSQGKGSRLPEATFTLESTTTLEPSVTPEPSATPESTTTATPPQVSATLTPWDIPAGPFPLAQAGPYPVRLMHLVLTDSQRENRTVPIMIWYPARDRLPDTSGAPYPLILCMGMDADIFAGALVSHGFVVVSLSNVVPYVPWDQNLIDQPQDFLFVLDQVVANPPDGFEGMIDAEHTGAIGYSTGGLNSLVLGGARYDPAFFLDRCANVSTLPPEMSLMSQYYCPLVDEWDAFVAHAGDALTASQDGLWQPMTDARIKAIIPISSDGSWLFGDKGLAAVDRPALIMAGTQDGLYPEIIDIYHYLGAPKKVLISFIDQKHTMIGNDAQAMRMKHFAVAFFGYHLQGRPEYAAYFSEEFVSQSEGLAWGVYSGK
jgi:predicted dienelactone hydrolase